MKNIIWIVLVGFFLSCSNKDRMMESKMNDVIESYNDELILKEFNLEDLTSQKLLEYYDLIQLKKVHPEFKEDIIKQLNTLANEPLQKNIKSTTAISIENIRQMGEIEQLSDSVQRIKLQYNIIEEKTRKADSVYATITSKNIFIDNLETKSTYVVFSLID